MTIEELERYPASPIQKILDKWCDKDREFRCILPDNFCNVQEDLIMIIKEFAASQVDRVNNMKPDMRIPMVGRRDEQDIKFCEGETSWYENIEYQKQAIIKDLS